MASRCFRAKATAEAWKIDAKTQAGALTDAIHEGVDALAGWRAVQPRPAPRAMD
jgi:hypothetical protein